MRCIIVEDEIPAQRILQNYISKFPELELLGSFQSALKANDFIREHDPDLIFMDINLPDITGINYLKTLTSPPLVIMTTAYHEHAVESFELETICDYLVKPFSFERFLKAINKAKNQTFIPSKSGASEEIDHLFINVDKTLHRINTSDILYVASDKNYVTVVTKKARLSYIASLRNWMDMLPQDQFIQVHKSYIINHKVIEKITGNLLIISDEKIPVGRTFKTALLKKIKQA